MKKIACIVITFILLFTSLLHIAVAGETVNNISVFINEKEINFDVTPIMINDRVMVPFRKIFEEMGAQVAWFQEEQKIEAYSNNPMVTLYIGKNYANVGSRNITLDVAPLILNDRTLVPLRFIGEAFAKNVSYNHDTNSVYIEDRYNGNVYKDTVNNMSVEVVSGLEFGLCYNLDESNNNPASALFVQNEPSNSLAVPASQQLIKSTLPSEFDSFESFKKDYLIKPRVFSEDDKFELISIENDDVYVGVTTFENVGRTYKYKTYIHVNNEGEYIYISIFSVDETRKQIPQDEIIKCIKSAKQLDN